MKIPDNLRQMRFEDVRDRALAFWRWWIAELVTMVPPKARERACELLRDNSGVITIDTAGNTVVVSRTAAGGTSEIARLSKLELNSAQGRAAAEKVKAAGSAMDKVTVRIAAAELLRRIVILPAAAARNLRNIIKFELERVSPLDPNQIVFDYAVIARDKETNRLDVELRILKREIADNAVAIAQALGREPRTIGFTHDGKPSNEREFPVAQAASWRAQWQTFRVPALSGLVVVLGIGALLASYSREQETLDELSDQVAAAKSRALVVENLRDDINKANLGMAFLAQEKQSPLLVTILAQVTKILPDNTWLVEFELHGREVRIHGFSMAASSLIALFDGSPYFTNAQFRAPLVQGQNGAERFDLSFEVKGGAA